MTSLGYEKPLYILPFDHRGSFIKMFNYHGTLTTEQASEIAAGKELIYKGFKAALEGGVPEQKAAILVDEQFGAAILRDAAKHGYSTACPVEKSGQDEFDFEYGDNFAKHIEAFHPTFCKVLVRYNPEGDEKLNRRQAVRLKRLSEYLHGESRSLFMFELLVPPEKAHLDQVRGNKQAYDLEIRPRLMVAAIQQLQDAKVEPDVWKIEGLERQNHCNQVVAAARRGGREKVGCIVLGRGEDDNKVRDWVTTAAGTAGFIGFAVGRTIFWDPLARWVTNRNSTKETVAEISCRYRRFMDIFEEAAVVSGASRPVKGGEKGEHIDRSLQS